MLVYKTGEYGTLIKEVEVEKTNEKSVFIKHRKGFDTSTKVHRYVKRTTTGYNYFDTYNEAKKYLLDNVNHQIKRLYEGLVRRKGELQKIEDL